MIAYLVKTLLCAAILFLIYFLFLEREKMYRFNRFYLLFSIVFSFGVSFITIKTASPVVTVSELIAPANLPGVVAMAGGFDRLNHKENNKAAASDLKKETIAVPVEKKSQLPNLLLGLYIAGTAFFLFRFIRNLSKLLSKVYHNKSVAFNGARLVLSNDTPLPYSFLKYIFIDKAKYEQGSIEKEILQHELTHVNQKHTLDVLMVELITVFAWINPMLFLFRKAIMLNHEYLADEAVVNTFNDTENYRQLLFSKVCQSNNLVLSSSFNYLTTKKRLIMMTRKTSQKVAILKQVALIPMIAVIGFLFSTRVIAQEKPKQPASQPTVKFSPPHITPAISSDTDAPQSAVIEYEAIVKKYKIDTSAMRTHRLGPNATIEQIKEYGRITHLDTMRHFDKNDRTRLETLFIQMSKRQQDKQFVHFMPKPTLKTKNVPNKEQFESWKNPQEYGIWINGRRAKNSILNSYKNTDFSYIALRKLDKKAAIAMKYLVEVALTTKESFEKSQKEIAAMWEKNPEDKYDMVLEIHRSQNLNGPIDQIKINEPESKL